MTNAEKSRQWRLRNPEKAKAAQDRYRARHPGRRAEIWARHKATAKFKHNQAARLRRYKYGIEPHEFDRLILASMGRCQLCDRVAAPTGEKQLVVDHDHGSGLVRGVICNVCNQTLGFIEAHGLDRKWMEQALTYLGRLF